MKMEEKSDGESSGGKQFFPHRILRHGLGVMALFEGLVALVLVFFRFGLVFIGDLRDHDVHDGGGVR